MRKYFKILDLEVRHDDKTYTGLSFELLERSQLLCADYRLVVKYSPAGLAIYAPIIEAKNSQSFFIPIEEPITLRWLVKAQETSFFNKTQLPPIEGLYYISNDPGDGVRFNKFPYSLYGGLDKPGTHTEFLFGYVGRYYQRTHQLVVGDTTIELDPPPVSGSKVRDYSTALVFSGTDHEVQFKDRGSKIIKSTVKIGEVTENITTVISYPIPVRAFSDSFLVMDLVLNPSEAENNKNRISLEETLKYHLLFRKKTE